MKNQENPYDRFLINELGQLVTLANPKNQIIGFHHYGQIKTLFFCSLS